jgi:hypothetical protein
LNKENNCESRRVNPKKQSGENHTVRAQDVYRMSLSLFDKSTDQCVHVESPPRTEERKLEELEENPSNSLSVS